MSVSKAPYTLMLEFEDNQLSKIGKIKPAHWKSLKWEIWGVR